MVHKFLLEDQLATTEQWGLNRTKAWRGLAKLLKLGSYLQSTAVELIRQEKVLPPDPGPRSSTKTTVAIAAGFTRSTTPANYYLLANPRLAEAPESGTSVLGTGQGSFRYNVNYILNPMYPQHRTLTEYEIINVKTSMENAVDTRAVGIVANTLKARRSATEQELRDVVGDPQSHDQAPTAALKMELPRLSNLIVTRASQSQGPATSEQREQERPDRT